MKWEWRPCYGGKAPTPLQLSPHAQRLLDPCCGFSLLWARLSVELVQTLLCFMGVVAVEAKNFLCSNSRIKCKSVPIVAPLSQVLDKQDSQDMAGDKGPKTKGGRWRRQEWWCRQCGATNWWGEKECRLCKAAHSRHAVHTTHPDHTPPGWPTVPGPHPQPADAVPTAAAPSRMAAAPAAQPATAPMAAPAVAQTAPDSGMMDSHMEDAGQQPAFEPQAAGGAINFQPTLASVPTQPVVQLGGGARSPPRGAPRKRRLVLGGCDVWRVCHDVLCAVWSLSAPIYVLLCAR